MNDAADRNDKVMKGVDRETIRGVLDNYAHGGTVEQCAESAGVDYDTAYQIIADAIAAQKSAG
ncbi:MULTISPECIES: hypothetical protein [Pacificibacter]|uniref:hypothetical protein n=1 Tax=Pacificibacter TaxID=1042323 RepID=UPI001C07F169|nr:MULTISPECIES: hypothetical protein [Pacificibacter]MBU2936492.1 hypothetical protein [Pacificibacter marinus]MDO6614706.1 hypothetical protein [Pacificibacter sp. 1_MG-2023]